MSRQNFPKKEEEILHFWEKNNIFQKSLEKDSPKGSFVFYEGPPTANGKPGIHHVEARAFKDCIPRFRTMQGYKVERKGGWDTHGLPVELEVEKQLGFTGKKDIEQYGIAKFNAKCKESVWKYLEDWTAITKRIGFWVDLENPYVTYEPEYIESLWWIVKQVWDKGLLYKDYRVTPHCPRCGTSLSSHELAQGYKDVKDLSLTAKFRVVQQAGGNGEPDEPTYILAWTTTPWTLPGNVGLAVGPKISYVKARVNGELVWVAKERIEEITTGDFEIIEEKLGEDLVGSKYEPLYPFLGDIVSGENKTKLEEKAYFVYPADFVTTLEGTGIVHTAVMYGQDDFALGTEVGLPKQHLVHLDGTFYKETGFLSGRFVRDEQVAVDIIKDLARRGLLFSKEKYQHSYPHCWRCKTPVIYYAKDSWYIRMSDLRDRLLAENEYINWEPSHIKQGRFGEWLREVKDWAFSRERYWGTPLPIWECQECEGTECVGSFAELRKMAISEVPEELDPHRPIVDEIDIKCSSCGGTAKRVADVCDVWFDSGSMPFAQRHYPFENKEKIDSGEAYPADYISEAIDQTRGWFYTLLAVSTLLGKERPYKNVICLGHLNDAEGKKMSKSVGNVVDPNEMINTYGADAVRWYMYTITQPGESKRFDEKILDEMVKKLFMILGNVQSFYGLYRNKLDDAVLNRQPHGHVMDRWIMARLNQLVKQNTQLLEDYKVTEPTRAIGEFVTELSQWYVRRSRDRFKGVAFVASGSFPAVADQPQAEDPAEDAARAVATLGEVLLTLAKLMAPFTPFFAESLYQDLSGEKESVHLEDWPVAVEGAIDNELLADMEKARHIVSLALEQREEAKINVRQALGGMTVRGMQELAPEIVEVIKEEVNVKQVMFEKGDELQVQLDSKITPELRREGLSREIIRSTNAMRKKQGLTIEDRVVLTVKTNSQQVGQAVEEFKEAILRGTLANDIQLSALEGGEGGNFEIEIQEV